ncbi:cell division protein FtsQ/DivIB [Polycladidibacter hongkongensis]|uniref:cell division protein FtsQ/DivIB n=1 Tax=Polycladidibacter hongkongensis TaxID=1647556 RepID=UPI000A878BCF|nr:cell division protein FtsQ/DivIB [Pseudovibrio hongkongensis]
MNAWRGRWQRMGLLGSRRGVSRLHQRPAWGVTGIFALLPRSAGPVGAAAVLAAFTTYGIVLGGHGQQVSESVTATLGFSVDSIEIDGLDRLDELQILEKLEMGVQPSLVMFDAQAAQERIQQLAWVKHVSLQKFYPGTLKITVEEQEPYALWQRGDVVSVINRDGQVITDQVDGRYANLLRVVNHGAQHRADEIIDALSHFPELRARVRAASLRSERRWDLNLDNGVVVRLPETGVKKVLAELVQMDWESGLLNRDITVVDMRLKDRVVVRLSDAAALRRKAAVQARAAQRKRGAAI